MISPIERTYALLETSVAQFDINDWSLLELTGADRLEWLQGQATNDLRGLAEGETRQFCLCKPTGQIEAVCTVTALVDRLLLSCPVECAKVVLTRVEDMVILEEVKARDITSSSRCLSLQGSNWAKAKPSRAIVVENYRCGWGGADLWTAEDFELRDGVVVGDSRALEIARVEAGIPTWGVDIGPKTLPPELGPAFEARHVSYQKGCYTGQEVLMRLHSRGHTNWTWRGLRCGRPVEGGSPVIGSNGESVGSVTSAVTSPRFGPIATARLRNGVPSGAQVGIQVGHEKVAAQVYELPFRQVRLADGP